MVGGEAAAVAAVNKDLAATCALLQQRWGYVPVIDQSFRNTSQWCCAAGSLVVCRQLPRKGQQVRYRAWDDYSACAPPPACAMRGRSCGSLLVYKQVDLFSALDCSALCCVDPVSSSHLARCCWVSVAASLLLLTPISLQPTYTMQASSRLCSCQALSWPQLSNTSSWSATHPAAGGSSMQQTPSPLPWVLNTGVQ